jgi:hypothetical protein
MIRDIRYDGSTQSTHLPVDIAGPKVLTDPARPRTCYQLHISVKLILVARTVAPRSIIGIAFALPVMGSACRNGPGLFVFGCMV